MPEIESNDTRQTATLLGNYNSGTLSSPSDVDWYAFEVTSAIGVSFQNSLYGYEYFTVTDAAGNVIFESASYTTRTIQVLTPGTYYAQVSASEFTTPGGTYSVLVLPPMYHVYTPEPNNSAAAAVVLNPLQSGLLAGQISSQTDEDWFRIDMPAGNGNLTFNFETVAGSAAFRSPAVTSVQVSIGGVVQTLAPDANGFVMLENLTAGPVYLKLDATSFDEPVGNYIDYAFELHYQTTRNHIEAPASAAAPTDTRFAEQWYLGTAGVDVLPVWVDYTGAGTRIALIGDGIAPDHADLDNNYTGDFGYSIQYSPEISFNGDTRSSQDRLSTAAAGIAAAERNGTGIVGVAYNAELGSIYLDQGYRYGAYLSQAIGLAAAADVVLLPGLGGSSFQRTDFYRGSLEDAAADGRSGLGAVVVGGAGDDAINDPRDTNESIFTNDRHIVTVAATDRHGIVTDYSRAGSSILVSAPGGTAAEGLLTTDPIGSAGAGAGDHAAQFGTLYAAAAVSGVVALMLEANPDLGWRDVQEILALSARATDPGHLGWQVNGATGWNGGGLYYSEFYGYGMVDARAAVRLAESWTDQQTSANESLVSATRAITLPVPDNSITGVSTTLDLSALTVDRIEVMMQFAHTWMGDMIVDLISPSGTVANLIFVPGSGLLQQTNVTGFVFGSAAFLGENAAGTWTLVLRDVQAQDTGTLFDWSLKAYGSAVSADDTYVYTDEFATLTDSPAQRQTLNDTNGGIDTINLAAVSSNATISLWGSPSSIGNRSLNIAANVIENAIGGDGNDFISGNALANELRGNRGDDKLIGGAGADTLDGGAGYDATNYWGSSAGVTVYLSPAQASLNAGGDAAGDVLVGMEAVVGSYFNDLLTGDDQGNFLNGDDGNDTVRGGAGNDYLWGGLGIDVVEGGDGFDVAYVHDQGLALIRVTGIGSWEAVYSGGGVEVLTGVEVIEAGNGASVEGTGGDDQISTGWGNDTLLGGTGNDYLASGNHADSLAGGDGYDWLWAGNGEDTLDGGADKDNLSGEAGNDVIYGGAGNDRITGRDDNDTIHGGDGDDWVGVWNDWGEDPALNYFPEWGNDRIFGDAGDDVLSAGLGTDTVDGGLGNDYVAGEQDNDSLSGGEGFDWLWAGDGEDTLDGGAEKDNLNGEAGNDLIFAGSGNDRITGRDGNDTINAGDGNDWVGVWNDWGEDPARNYFPESGNDSINGDAGNDVLSAGFGADTVRGGADDDYVAGEQDNDSLFGDAGIDWLWGGSGTDTLDGGTGSDVLIGEDGFDLLTGGAGADVFRFNHLSEAGDRILDFSIAEGDRIDVSDLLFHAGYGGADPFAEGRLTRAQAGTDVALRFDGTLIASIDNLTVAQLQTNLFIV